MSNLTIKEVKHEEEHPVCEKCSAKMTEIGEEKVYDEFVYVPGEFYVRRHIVKNTSVRNVVRTLRKMRNTRMKLNPAIFAVLTFRSR